MTKLFHNTANSDKAETHEGIKRNYKQNDAILRLLKDNKDQSFNAWMICSCFHDNNPYYGKLMLITSVRRALTTLEQKGLIKKVGTTKGIMKVNNITYQYVTDKPLLCKSLPKQIKRTPEHGC